MTQAQIDDLQRQIQSVTDIEDISDGFHTFKSLYHQRLYLFAALVKAYKNLAWKSTRHHDGELCFDGGWFIVGITTPLGDYTYHYELKDWNLFDCKVLEKAPEWDGHTDVDVTRVQSLNMVLTNQQHPTSELQPKNDGESMKEWYVTAFNDRQKMAEFLNKHKLKPEDFKFSDSGVGTPYTILYYSDKCLY